LPQGPQTAAMALPEHSSCTSSVQHSPASEPAGMESVSSYHNSDTMRDLQRSQGEAFLKMAEQLEAQEHCWQKEKNYLELQYSCLLAEAQARQQEYQAAAQNNREKIYVLEKNQEKLAHENVSLLAACALLSGALCPLYGRLCALSSQKNILQGQVNTYELVNQKIRTIVRAAAEENIRNEASLRERKFRGLVYVFRRAVVMVLAANRLRALAQQSNSLFTWTKGLEQGTGIQVCIGESEGKRNVSRYRGEGVDCSEVLGWLTSSNLHAVIISSLSELQDVLS
ncbi:CC171 protein, partial [Sapayoa aenigma]|nr:CC171 protein [Sapayoa aenigma]